MTDLRERFRAAEQISTPDLWPAVQERLAKVDDAKWTSPGDFRMGGQSVWSTTVQDLCWGYLFDMVHHRGQLSAYLRPMGGKVPSIYGPSADDSGQ